MGLLYLEPAMDKKLKNYELLEKIAEGGFGEVWKGLDCESDQIVALKILKCAQKKASLEKEVETLQGLEHPGLVKIHKANFESPPFFLVLEYCPGQTMKEMLTTSEGPVLGVMEEVVPKILEIAAYLHDQGVVHGDLKPANIMVEEDGSFRLIDFGLARSYELEELAQSMSMTMQQAQGGTLYYLAPEVMEEGKVTPASDVFSLGVIIYEILTGYNYPFDQLRQMEPLWVRNFLKKALARRPSDRYLNAQRMLKEWKRALPEAQRMLKESKKALPDVSKVEEEDFAPAGTASPGAEKGGKNSREEERESGQKEPEPHLAPASSGSASPSFSSASLAREPSWQESFGDWLAKTESGITLGLIFLPFLLFFQFAVLKNWVPPGLALVLGVGICFVSAILLVSEPVDNSSVHRPVERKFNAILIIYLVLGGLLLFQGQMNSKIEEKRRAEQLEKRQSWDDRVFRSSSDSFERRQKRRQKRRAQRERWRAVYGKIKSREHLENSFSGYMKNNLEEGRTFILQPQRGHLLLVGKEGERFYFTPFQSYTDRQVFLRQENTSLGRIPYLDALPPLFHHQGTHFAMVGAEGRLKVWKIRLLEKKLKGWRTKKKPHFSYSRSQMASFKIDHFLYSMAFHPKKNVVVTGGERGLVRFWDFGRKEMVQSFQVGNTSISAIGFSRDGKTLLLGTKKGEVFLIHRGAIQRNKIFPLQRIVFIAKIPHKRVAIVALENGKTFLWDWEREKREVIWEKTGAQINRFDLSPDGRYLLRGGKSYLQVRDLEKKRDLPQFYWNMEGVSGSGYRRILFRDFQFYSSHRLAVLLSRNSSFEQNIYNLSEK